MKKIILAIFLFLFFIQNGQSQIAPRVVKETTSFQQLPSEPEYILLEEIDYHYNSLGDTTSIETTEHFNLFSGTNSWTGKFYEYDYNHLLKKKSQKRYNPDVDLWITESWIEYEYDVNGCLIQESIIQNVGGPYENNQVFYERNKSCQQLSRKEEKTYLLFGSTFSVYNYYESNYYSDGISYVKKFYEFVETADSNFLKIAWVYIYDDQNKLIEHEEVHFNNNNSTLVEVFATKKILVYDDYGNIKEEHFLTKNYSTSEWELIHIDFFDNEYDENEFLISVRKERYFDAIFSIDSEFTILFTYQNSCKGFTEEEVKLYENNGAKIKKVFAYEGIDECIDIEKISLTIQISPNPSNGNFKITSSIFQTGNTNISVFATDGKVLLQKTEVSRSTFSNIDLSSLLNGLYILHLSNGDHFVNEKIVIAK